MKKIRVRSNAVYDVMLRRCITQRELARRAGISPAVLSMLLSGRRFAGPTVRSRLLSTPLLKPLGYDGLFQVEGYDV
jgi:transcriptional regulator with XRE-family HTH domain